MNIFLSIILMIVSAMSIATTPLIKTLSKYQGQFALVLPAKYQLGKVKVLDIAKDSKDFKDIDIYSTEALVKHSHQLRKSSGADMMIGRYLEDRNIYKRGDHYHNPGEEARSVHLGQDLMVPPGTAVYAPWPGKIHSFKDNKEKADYGPTIILQHKLDGITFYTLYGHLSRESLKNLKVGQSIKKHQQIATVGKPFENGGWPEHLHFQIIDDMQGEKGNFIGVIQPSKAKQYAKHCPNPNLILHIDALKND